MENLSNKKSPIISLKSVYIISKRIRSKKLKDSFLTLKRTINILRYPVKNISLDVNKGEIIGIVGDNGSGKTTLLKTIAGILTPNKGAVVCKDRATALLSLKAGTDKNLSGLQNIYIIGYLNGFTKEEIKAKESAIIKFSGLAKKMQKLYTTYTDIEKKQLVFSIYLFLNKKIFLIDNLLSTGNKIFKTAAKEKMSKIIHNKNKTVIFTATPKAVLKENCDRVLWLSNGRIREIGEPDIVVKKYLAYIQKKHST
ncbi:MAG: ATP-binding cassette domain-containing protein [Clostridiales Family XIII bacterium]|nr:ATP-binding cassette domain-containing protein [Clostridiales Family XIII bacterium]